ncbi:MAG: putative sulfate/molybdate transporter [bacterium]
MSERFKFNRLEVSGSLGDLGTLLPIAIAMILINGLNPLGLFFSIGLFYIFSGIYFGVTVPVQPMKVIGAYAIATAMSASQVYASGLLLGVILLLIGLTGAIDLIKKYTSEAVVKGVQVSIGTVLAISGFKFILGTSNFQTLQSKAESILPNINSTDISGIAIGIVFGILTLLLLNNKKFPAGLVVVVGGIILGIFMGYGNGMGLNIIGFNLPELLPFDFPKGVDFNFALIALVLPQIPMTIGNAVLAYTDLSKQYFGEKSSRVTNRGVCISMALANFFSFLVGGMPLCHGAGGLAAHYRFGARTAGSNIFIGAVFVILAVIFGKHILSILHLLPMAVLGVLLVFSGLQLAVMVKDLKNRKDLFVVMLMLALTLTTNLAAAFIAGIIVAQLLRWEKLSV